MKDLQQAHRIWTALIFQRHSLSCAQLLSLAFFTALKPGWQELKSPAWERNLLVDLLLKHLANPSPSVFIPGPQEAANDQHPFNDSRASKNAGQMASFSERSHW